MEMVLLKKGTAAIRAFFKRPQKIGHLVLCYIGLYTILQFQLVSARHHDLGKLLPVSNNDDNNFNENQLHNLQQPNINAQINHSHENTNIHLPNQQLQIQPVLQQQNQQQQQTQEQNQQQQQPILKQQPILGQKVTQQSGSDPILGPSGAVLSKDDGKYQNLIFLI
jgi:hypothetical protein